MPINYKSSVTDRNPKNYIYINGDAFTDGSRRFSVNGDSGMAIIEKRIMGIWQPTSFETGPTSVWVGKNVGIAGLGHHLATESSDGHYHFHAHSEFDGETCIKDTQIVNAYNYTERQIIQPDNSGNWTGTTFNTIIPSVIHNIQYGAYLQTYSTAASEMVRVSLWVGTDDTGILVFDQKYPSIEFPADTEIRIVPDGYLEFDAGVTYYMRLSSVAEFSLKTDSTLAFPWLAADSSLVTEDNLLQTKPWKDGDSWNEDDYFIDSRNIYICNTTGVQTGTFEENSDKWDSLDKALTWSKSIQPTGLIAGGLITNPNPFVLDWTAGSGRITDYTDPTNPIIHEISWNAVTGYSPTHIGTSGQYIITYNSNGDIEELLGADIGPELIRSNIVLGGFSVMGPYIFRVVPNALNLGYGLLNSFKDFMRDVIGPANIRGNIFSANGTNLKLDKNAGVIFIIGSNLRNSTTVTDELTLPLGTAVTFSRVGRQAPPSQDMLPDGAGMVDEINPTLWDDGSGVFQPVGNKYSIQVVYIMPDGGVIVAYGQQLFNQESAAQQALSQGTLEYEEYPILFNFVRRTFIIIQGSETNASNAIFAADGKFRTGGISGGGTSDHASLDNLEWDVSGHLFENGGTLNIGNYDFITTNTIRSNGGSLILAENAVATYPSIQNVINNFDNYTGLLIKKIGTGTGDYLQIKNSSDTLLFGIDTVGSLTLNDGTRDRIVSNTSYLAAYSPNGIYYIMAATGQISLNDGSGPRVFADSADTALYSPAAAGAVVVRDAGITIYGDLILDDDIHYTTSLSINDGTRDRIVTNTTHVTMVSPDGTIYLSVNNTDVAVTGPLSVTEYLSAESLTVSGNGLDGSTLLNFNMVRRWAFQQEGSGTAAALRLRNTLGQNKHFSIDTDGSFKLRGYSGSPTYLTHTKGVFTLNDGTRNRILSNASHVSLYSPDGTNVLYTDNTNAGVNGDFNVTGNVIIDTNLTIGNDILYSGTLNINDGTNNRALFNTIFSRINSPDDDTNVQVSNTGIDLINDGIVQVGAGDYGTFLRSPDGTSIILDINNTKAELTGNLQVNGDTEIKNVAAHSYITINTDVSAAYDAGIRFQHNGVDKWVMYSDTSHSTFYLNFQTNLTRIKIDPSRFIYNDVTRDRIDIHATGTVLIDPLGEATLTLDDADAFDFNSTTHAILFPRMTTTQLTALTAVNGMIVYDSTLNLFKGYENSGWRTL